RVAQTYLLKVVVADLGVLLGHRHLGHTHIRHLPAPPQWISSSASCSIRQAWRFSSSASSLLYTALRLISSSKSTWWPSKSGPSTQANFILPPTVTRQPPHMPVQSI